MGEQIKRARRVQEIRRREVAFQSHGMMPRLFILGRLTQIRSNLRR